MLTTATLFFESMMLSYKLSYVIDMRAFAISAVGFAASGSKLDLYRGAFKFATSALVFLSPDDASDP